MPAPFPTITAVLPKTVAITAPFDIFAPEEAGGKLDSDKWCRLVIRGTNLKSPDTNSPYEFKVMLGPVQADTVRVSADGTMLTAIVSDPATMRRLIPGTYPVQVLVNDAPVPVVDPDHLDQTGVASVSLTGRPVTPWTTLWVFILAMLATAALFAVLILLIGRDRKTRFSANRDSPLAAEVEKAGGWARALLLDEQTSTYSLSRAQFAWWLTIIVFGYIFLLIGRGLVSGTPVFIPLSGFAYTFLISLTTLVTSQAATSVRGSKGAGDFRPSAADLILQGGRLALDRVQQVIWNLVIGIAFLVIVVMTYQRNDGFPTIPPELLVLMGVSAAGYIGGKMARKPGPTIGQVTADSKNRTLSITGDNLSLGTMKLPQGADGKYTRNEQMTDQGVTIQIGVGSEPPFEVPKDNVVTLATDATSSLEFARTLLVLITDPKKDAAWFANFTASPGAMGHITVINADGQYASWQPPGEPVRPVPAPQGGNGGGSGIGADGAATTGNLPATPPPMTPAPVPQAGVDIVVTPSLATGNRATRL